MQPTLLPLPKKALPKILPFIHQPHRFDWRIRKDGKIFALLKTHQVEYDFIEQKVWGLQSIMELGELKGEDFIPSHELALSVCISNAIPAVELNFEQSLRYLKKEHFDLTNVSLGWTLVKYKGVALGWVKVIKDRINNYLPQKARILMDISQDLFETNLI